MDLQRVSHVYEKCGSIYHIVENPIEVGTRVKCSVDFEERYEKMQCHSAEHILSGLFYREYGLSNVGFHLGAQDVTMDVSAPLSPSQILLVERMANDIVAQNVPIEQIFPTSGELENYNYRAKLDLTENVRLVRIGEYDLCACCAPHVRSTAEIGLIKVADFEKLRGGMRIHITAGRRACNLFFDMYDNLSEISHALSVPRLKTAEAVAKLSFDMTEMRRELKLMQTALCESKAGNVPPVDGNFVAVLNADYDGMRAYANIAVSKVGGILAVLSGTDGEYKYILASNKVDLKKGNAKINAALNGKGGGNAEMQQGIFTASLSEIKEYFT